MSDFKAANPGCDLEDFIDWYGQPRSALTDDQQAQELLSSLSSSTMDAPNPEPCPSPPPASSLAVERTREFGSKTWKETPSVVAEDQEPLFRASDTVEIALNDLDTLHPANLISSVLATNLSNAYFSLVISAQVGADIGEDATHLASMHASLTQSIASKGLQRYTGGEDQFLYVYQWTKWFSLSGGLEQIFFDCL